MQPRDDCGDLPACSPRLQPGLLRALEWPAVIGMGCAAELRANAPSNSFGQGKNVWSVGPPSHGPHSMPFAQRRRRAAPFVNLPADCRQRMVPAATGNDDETTIGLHDCLRSRSTAPRARGRRLGKNQTAADSAASFQLQFFFSPLPTANSECDA